MQATTVAMDFWFAAAWHRVWFEETEPFIAAQLGKAPPWLKCYPRVHTVAAKLQENAWRGGSAKRQIRYPSLLEF